MFNNKRNELQNIFKDENKLKTITKKLKFEDFEELYDSQ
jgi:hypothetical protein